MKTDWSDIMVDIWFDIKSSGMDNINVYRIDTIGYNVWRNIRSNIFGNIFRSIYEDLK